MREEVKNLSILLSKVHELAIKVDDMIEGFDTSKESVSINMELVFNYLESYEKFTKTMGVIRQNPPSVYISNPDERELVMSAIMRESQYKAQADRCMDLVSRIGKYITDLGLGE